MELDPTPELTHALNALRELPAHIATRLTTHLEGIWLGSGAAPGLAGLLHLPGGTASAGGVRMLVGTGPHVSASLAHHLVGHLLYRLDTRATHPEWRRIMSRCVPVLRQDHYHSSEEWWAESYALVATGRAHRLLRLLSCDDAVARSVWNHHKTCANREPCP
ncbi:hypothetical protein [Acrocarpospora catenulata]|uniref:hypothetical protein n=1 Tax=Acrocarpospora catenulata TaxID=2836182 RepID=UPI001BDA49F3|nr:hypothetical protein [Acrocarpospora catenulata]